MIGCVYPLDFVWPGGCLVRTGYLVPSGAALILLKTVKPYF